MRRVRVTPRFSGEVPQDQRAPGQPEETVRYRICFKLLSFIAPTLPPSTAAEITIVFQKEYAGDPSATENPPLWLADRSDYLCSRYVDYSHLVRGKSVQRAGCRPRCADARSAVDRQQWAL